MIIYSSRELRENFHQLGPGDACVGHLSFSPGEEYKVVDLMHRGINFYPSLLSAFLSRSKVLQAEVLSQFMLPDTFVAYRSIDLCRNQAAYTRYGSVVSKRDRKHLGMGVGRWSSLEELQRLDSLGALPFPLVIQPFLEEARDFRVVIIDDHAEAYERINPYSYRKNLAQCGTASPVHMDSTLLAFCTNVMQRGDFPYALLDILQSPAGDLYLAEISLMGGLSGSSIGHEGFLQRKKLLQEKFCRRFEGQ
ncbi:hypothetical protein Dthio_PD3389 [Desulfonatronospira thiodismutans ASO3-1]|uniref:RimK domain protein ATP-grasp n=1 Tax=Desulfonatronospira thiodismutans ASO3-1 TaxID=555779 RepID=D6SMN6_9BACT|nr:MULTISPECIES: hypothetical protein [Desulfonatronospira]EFI35947.1 hypothetical protein Dthio_PD3389 [Desulfonatronospira thiodismutans ASO3-1]RQD79298.1 MAG: hypothetical protein D5S03_00395 [Desulfonatronospira sp. MSAO_Bac3]